jgi:hypothetical protein
MVLLIILLTVVLKGCKKSEDVVCLVEANEIVEKLEACPAWSETYPGGATYPDNGKARKQIVKLLEEIRQYPLDVVRAGIKQYVSKKQESATGYDVAEMSRLYLLNKYIFVIPEKVPFGLARFFGGWSGIPHGSEGTELLWPFSKNPDGTLSLTGDFGGYNGPKYAAIDAFDYYREVFGKRKMHNQNAEGPTALDKFFVIADKNADYEQVLQAVQKLGPVKEGWHFWTHIANNDNYAKLHRRLCIIELFKRHLSGEVVVYQVTYILGESTWFKDEHLGIVANTPGEIPVALTANATVFVIHIFPELSENTWAVYFKVSGETTRDDLLKMIRGKGQERWARDDKILETVLCTPGFGDGIWRIVGTQ